MAKSGRPSKFDTVNLDNVRLLAERGFTDKEMSNVFGITEQTWNNWKSAHPHFFESLKEWKRSADANVERALFERATGYSHPEDKIFNDSGKAMRVETVKHYPPDTTAGIFWLKNRQPDKWRDKVDIESEQDVHVHIHQVAKDF